MLDQYGKTVVTGGAGFIGRHLVSALLALEKNVVILDNFSNSLDTPTPPGATIARADIRDPAQVAEVVKGAELIFHTAANANGTVSVEDPRFDFETNARGTFNVLEAALAAGTKRFVYVSSASVYGIPERFPMAEDHPLSLFMPYGASKLTGELYCRSFFASFGLSVVMGRPFPVYGTGENPKTSMVEVSRYLRWHLNQKPIQVVGDAGRKTRDFVHVSDLVQALLLLADKADDGEVFNIGSGDEISRRELTEVIGSVTGRTAVVDELSKVTEDTYRLVPDISKIKALGYVPRMSIEEGTKQLAEELGENPELPSGTTIFKKGQQAEK